VYKGGVACSDMVLLSFVIKIAKAKEERDMDTCIVFSHKII
jgi:hypothetical protein